MEVGDNFELFKVLKTSLQHYEKKQYLSITIGEIALLCNVLKRGHRKALSGKC